jgi:hypothetical protein
MASIRNILLVAFFLTSVTQSIHVSSAEEKSEEFEKKMEQFWRERERDQELFEQHSSLKTWPETQLSDWPEPVNISLQGWFAINYDNVLHEVLLFESQEALRLNKPLYFVIVSDARLEMLLEDLGIDVFQFSSKFDGRFVTVSGVFQQLPEDVRFEELGTFYLIKSITLHNPQGGNEEVLLCRSPAAEEAKSSEE